MGRDPHVTEGKTSKEHCRAQGRRWLSSGCKLIDTTSLNAFSLGFSEAFFWLTSNNKVPTSKDQRRDSIGKLPTRGCPRPRNTMEAIPGQGSSWTVCAQMPWRPTHHTLGGLPIMPTEPHYRWTACLTYPRLAPNLLCSQRRPPPCTSRELGITAVHSPHLHPHFCGTGELAQGLLYGRR